MEEQSLVWRKPHRDMRAALKHPKSVLGKYKAGLSCAPFRVQKKEKVSGERTGRVRSSSPGTPRRRGSHDGRHHRQSDGQTGGRRASPAFPQCVLCAGVCFTGRRPQGRTPHPADAGLMGREGAGRGRARVGARPLGIVAVLDQARGPGPLTPRGQEGRALVASLLARRQLGRGRASCRRTVAPVLSSISKRAGPCTSSPSCDILSGAPAASLCPQETRHGQGRGHGLGPHSRGWGPGSSQRASPRGKSNRVACQPERGDGSQLNTTRTLAGPQTPTQDPTHTGWRAPPAPPASGGEPALLGTSEGGEGANAAVMTTFITHHARALPAMSLLG